MDVDDGSFAVSKSLTSITFIVTGDPDLLNLVEHAGIRIVSPRLFLDVLAR